MKNTSNTILYFFTGSYPYGDVETFIENEIKYLSSEFKKVIVIPADKSDSIRDVPGNVLVDDSLSQLFTKKNRKIKSIFTVHFLLAIIYHWKYVFNIRAMRRVNSFVSDSLLVTKWLKKNSINENSIIYTYWLNGKTFGAIKYKTKYNHNIKIVSRTHRYDLYDYWFNPSFWPYRQRTLDLIDKLYVISMDGINFLRSKYRVGNNVEISRLGIDDRNKLSSSSLDTNIRIVSVANLNKVKRIPLLFKYLEKYSFNNNQIDVFWTHFGDGPEMPIINNLISNSNSENLFSTLKGRVPNEYVYKYYDNEFIDIFINLSESEGVPVSIMEAQSYGIFVIATDVGGTKELIVDNYGFLISKDPSYEDFKNAMDSFVKKRDIYKGLNMEIRKNCLNYFNAAKNYPRFAKSMIKLLDK